MAGFARTIALGLAVSACGPRAGAGADSGSCAVDSQTCDGNDLLVCVNGAYERVETCRSACAAGLGCVEPDTAITYEPAQAGAPTTLTAAGEFIELPMSDATFQVSANKKILVAQYMTGQQAGGDTGDPAMTIAVATRQYRSNYLFHAPLNYETNYVNVTAPDSAEIILDGVSVDDFTPIGASGFGLKRVVLGAGMGGNHRISGNAPFGITVYGYGSFTSYWYPGGTELAEITVD